MQSLKGKVAVVTGGGGVLCSIMSKELAKNGAKVAVLDLRKEAADKVADEIKKEGYEAIGVECNVLIKDSIVKARNEVEKAYGTCDILINGAGGNHPKGTTSKEYFDMVDLEDGNEDVISFFDLDPDGIEFVFKLNLIGSFMPTQVFAKDMVKKESSTIINISSMSAFSPLTKIPAYSGAKAAISNFTQWLSVHFANAGIRVNAIAPGFFLTKQNEKLLLNEDGSYTERSHKIVSQTPLRRFGKPEELLGTLMWLVDDDKSGFVTGTVIPVDGGFAAYSGV